MACCSLKCLKCMVLVIAFAILVSEGCVMEC